MGENEDFPRKNLKPLDLATLIKVGSAFLLFAGGLGMILYAIW